MQPPPNPPHPVAPNKAALVALVALGGAIGLLPYFLFVDRPAYLWAIVPAIAGVAFLSLRDFRTAAAAHPGPGEWLLGAWSAVARPCAASLVGFMFYGLFYGGRKAFTGVARYLGFDVPEGDPSAWGFGASAWLVGLFAVAIAMSGAQELARQLYPREAWARSTFVALLARPKLIALGALGAVAALAAMPWLLDPHGVALPVTALLVLFYTSFPLAELGKEPADRGRAAVVDLLASVLEEAGYRVDRTPRTGKAEIDPLLQSVDLLAKSDDRAFAFEVKSAAPQVAVEWNEATAVRTAALLLSDEIAAGGGRRLPVEPVLTILGGTIAPSLEAFSRREHLPVVHLDGAADVIGNSRELVRRLQAAGLALSFPPPEAPVAT